MKRNKPKVKLKDIEDDNRTVADMDVEGMPWYMGRKSRQHKGDFTQLDLSRRERRAMFLGLIEAMLPIALIGIVLFSGIYAFLYFVWLG